MNVIFTLIVGHYVGDFALQSDYIARAKSPGQANWIHPMIAHCVIQAGTVYYATGSTTLASFEFSSHFVIDLFKCQGHLSYTTDQLLHLFCRVAWAALFIKGIC